MRYPIKSFICKSLVLTLHWVTSGSVQFWDAAFWNAINTVLIDLPQLISVLTQSSYCLWKTEAFWKRANSSKTLMVLHSCFFICGHSASGLSGFVARMNRDIKSAIFANGKKMFSGFPYWKERNCIFRQNCIFLNMPTLIWLLSIIDSFSVTYMTAVKVPLIALKVCFETAKGFSQDVKSMFSCHGKWSNSWNGFHYQKYLSLK